MSEPQSTTCRCGHPRSQHHDPIPHDPHAIACGEEDCGCPAYEARKPITWDAVVDGLTMIRDRIAWDQEQSRNELERGTTPNEAVMRSHRTRGHALRLAGERVATLLTHVEESTPPEPPARPLEAVLAELRELGHNYELSSYGPDSFSFRSRLASAGWPSQDDSAEEREAWRWRAESGEAYGSDVVQVADERVADIRKLRAERAEQAILVAILVAGLTPGWRARQATDLDLQAGRSGAWLVVSPDNRVVNGYDDEAEARAHVAGRNRDAIVLAIAAREAEDAEEQLRLAAEEQRREREASESAAEEDPS